MFKKWKRDIAQAKIKGDKKKKITQNVCRVFYLRIHKISKSSQFCPDAEYKSATNSTVVPLLKNKQRK